MWNKLGGASFRFLRLQISVGRFVGGGGRGMALVALGEHEMVKSRVSFVSSFLVGINE
jgi:hypothetical protein